MNRSWKNNSNNSSPGFVYFTPNKSQQSPSDTSDFLSFSESPKGSPKNSNFSPSSYSSPRKFRKSGNFSLQNSYRGGGYNRDLNQSFSSPQNNTYNDYNNSYNYNNSFDSYRSYNGNNYNGGQWRRSNGHRNKQKVYPNRSFDKECNKNASIYYDPTSLSDPWAELEEQLKQKEEEEKNEKMNRVSSEESSENESDSEASETTSLGKSEDNENSEEKSDENDEKERKEDLIEKPDEGKPEETKS